MCCCVLLFRVYCRCLLVLFEGCLLWSLLVVCCVLLIRVFGEGVVHCRMVVVRCWCLLLLLVGFVGFVVCYVLLLFVVI